MDAAVSADTTDNTKSTVSVVLKAGIPNIIYSSDAAFPYSKQISISAGNAVTHTMHVVVTGDLSNKPPRYASFPITKPFLVLRDPPGGDSAVHYSRVETTVKLSSESHEQYLVGILPVPCLIS